MRDTLEESIGNPHHPVGPNQERTLAALAKGKLVLEIGTGSGVSTRAMAKGARNVATFDVTSKVREETWPTLPRNAVPFDRRTEPLKQGGAGFDLIFVDGLHTEEAVKEDIREAFPLARPDATWVFHDCQMEAVQRAVTQSKIRFRVLDKVQDAPPHSSDMWVCERTR